MTQQTFQSSGQQDPNRLMNENEAADVLCYSVRALQNWRHRGGGPDFVRVSARSVRYRRADLNKWIADRTISNTSQIV
ncbi:helix-turn-helix domain-containing protein [Yoonia sp. F2084L]|uniref:helix-turn-helix transcriptional regulator n=1 Tax=Yoonia sp. F2084L TaxID=2926419 RepID=UPI001FF48A20|nr:helix-turn-helix domain-containing protein [Yoonia sp. F2084L]MCK0097618.1 helix-turn-helix domain-containing protein [Yoonia sp. F2084L]